MCPTRRAHLHCTSGSTASSARLWARCRSPSSALADALPLVFCRCVSDFGAHLSLASVPRAYTLFSSTNFHVPCLRCRMLVSHPCRCLAPPPSPGENLRCCSRLCGRRWLIGCCCISLGLWLCVKLCDRFRGAAGHANEQPRGTGSGPAGVAAHAGRGCRRGGPRRHRRFAHTHARTHTLTYRVPLYYPSKFTSTPTCTSIL